MYKRSLKAFALAEALTTPHAPDRYLELVDRMVTVRELRAKITRVHRAASGSLTLTLRPTWRWKGFSAGQFVQVGVVINGVRHTRCYSPCSSEHRRDGQFELTIKAHPHGLVSQYLHRQASVGMVIDLSQADGAFRLPQTRPDHLVLISGGSGITPVLSMLRTLVDEGYPGKVAFLHYATGPDAVAHRRDIDAIATRFDNITVAYGYPSAGGGDVEGHFDDSHLKAVAPWHRQGHTYVCGPPALMTAVRDSYDRRGLEHRLHSEEFVLSVPAATGTAEGRVSFTRSGVDADNSGATLLEQAESAGLTPEHGCRMGICFSCTALKRSGRTRNVRTGDEDTEPDQRIQLCVNAPVGDVAIDI